MPITLRTFLETDVDALNGLLAQYCQAHPPRTSPPAQFYLSPYFDGGQDVMCAFDEQGRLAGYAPFFAQGEHAWAEVMTPPEQGCGEQVRAALWDWLLERARRGGQARLYFQYYPHESEALRFVEGKGGQRRYGIYLLRRDLSQRIPSLPVPPGFNLRRWRMESENEQSQYLEGRNLCFPEAPTSLEEFQYFTQTPLWAQGVNIAAFAGEQLAASVLVFWEPESPAGSTEYVFTLPEYRGRGLARVLLAESLDYLNANGLLFAQLEVKAANRAALRVYVPLGYEVSGETAVYEVTVAPH
jgi:ribosomal protein S18 acetylase RimI-like enzyme